MNKKFTKVHEEEDVRLRGCSYNVASIYFHLKNKRDYFKNKNNGTCYDLIRCISEYTGICEKTVKRAIKTLKEIGLIETVIKGKVNHYSFPILEAIENSYNNGNIQENCQNDNSKQDKTVEEPNDTPVIKLPPVEENNTHEFNVKEIEEIIKEENNNINDMGNLLTLNTNTGKYEYSNTQKEEIKKKVIEKNTPVQQLNIDDYEPTMIDFKEFVKESYYTIKDIINDFNSQFNIRKQQGNERLRELLNTRYGRYYHDELVELIIENINKEKVA